MSFQRQSKQNVNEFPNPFLKVYVVSWLHTRLLELLSRDAPCQCPRLLQSHSHTVAVHQVLNIGFDVFSATASHEAVKIHSRQAAEMN